MISVRVDQDMRKVSEQGVALLLVIGVVALLTVLALGFTVYTLTDYQMSNEFEAHAEALTIADAGFNRVKASLETQDFTTLLSTATAVSQYVTYVEPAVGTAAARNPMAPLEARSINFSSPPSPVSTRQVKGLLTPATGTVFGGGRYFAKLTDNQDEQVIGLTDDPDVDLDGTVYLRVMGVRPGAPMELASYGSAVKNSVAIVEGMMRRDLSFHTTSSFSIYGQNVTSAQGNPTNFFNGSAFDLDGYDHSGWTTASILANHGHGGTPSSPGMALIYDDPINGDAIAVVQTIYDSLSPSQRNRIVGQAGPYGATPSLTDITADLRASSNSDATNIFDPNFIGNFAKRVVGVADIKYTGDTSLSGNNIVLGTSAAPVVTVVTGDLDIGGSGSGAGLLVVTGDFECQGNFVYEGLVLAIGKGSVQYGAGTLIGAVFAANVDDDDDGNYVFGIPELTVSGSTEIYHKGESVQIALSLLPMKTLSWREITPEIEP